MGKPLKIALTLEQCWHQVPGGTAVAGIGMARGLKEQPDIEVIGVSARHARPPSEAWTPPIRVEQLPLPRLLLYESWHRLRWPKVTKAVGDVNVIHATTLAIPPRSAPLVVTIHDLAFLNDPSHFTRRGLSFFKRGLALCKRDADLVVCPSEATLKHCRTVGFAQERLRLVPMGVETRAASDDEVAVARRRYGLTRPYVMWTGTIEPRKNLPRLIAAFGSLDRDVDLVLVGPRGWNESLGKLVRKSPRGDIKALGFVALDDLPPLYAGAEAFCFPSLFEGFGLPVLEAMAQGTPVITSRGTSTEEVAGDAAILVDPQDTSSIAEGLARVLEDGGLARELSERGRQRVTRYTWQATARSLVECYREVG